MFVLLEKDISETTKRTNQVLLLTLFYTKYIISSIKRDVPLNK